MYRVHVLAFYLSLVTTLLCAEPIKIAVISDLHFLSNELAGAGSALSDYEFKTGRDVVIMHEVLDKALEEIKSENPDYLFISGDISNHGEKQSHIDFIEKLNSLSKQGIQVLVIPGNHDINIPNARSYKGSAYFSTSSVTDKEFESLYSKFGFGQSLQRDPNSLSYLYELSKDIWLLAIDTNIYKELSTSSITRGRILPETLKWGLDILEEAKNKDITVIGMMHHGLVEHLPYQSIFFSDYLIDEWEDTSDLLADAGLSMVFTGHFHANDITKHTSTTGKNIFDVETGSLAQYPFPYRIVSLDKDFASIDTKFVEEVDSEPSLQEKYRIKHLELSRVAIGSKLKQTGLPLSDDARNVVLDLLVKMSFLHAKGDEIIDEDTYKLIERFSKVMGDDNFDISSFPLDFPPADNKVLIKLR